MPPETSLNQDLQNLVQLLNQKPQLAGEIERISAYAQGKGYGTATIDQEIAVALQLLNRSPLLAVDIGGNVGEYTAELRKKNPKLEIHTFEPAAINIEKLKIRFGEDANITIVPVAVSNAAGPSTLFCNAPGSGLASLTKRKLDHFNIDFSISEPVTTIRFEDYWATTLKKRMLDIVKIDIEGHELDALNGFGDAIQATGVLQFEFGGCNIDTRTYFQDFWYFFKQHRFELFRVTPYGMEKLFKYREFDEFFSTTNYIAVNQNQR